MTPTSLFTPTYQGNIALDWCAAQETRDALLQSMDGGQAIVAKLRLDGYTWRECGEAFGVSMQAVRYWMAQAAVNAYNECPELRDVLREYVNLCPFCDRAIRAGVEMCGACRRKVRGVEHQRYCTECGVPIYKYGKTGLCRNCCNRWIARKPRGGNGNGAGGAT